jgi:hypothetical protein
MSVGSLQRLDELLLARATEGLSRAGTRELERLLAAHPEADADAYERAAAAVTLAVLGTGGSLPSGLRAQLERRAAELAAEDSNGRR